MRGIVNSVGNASLNAPLNAQDRGKQVYEHLESRNVGKKA